MNISRRGFWLSVFGAVLGAVYLGLAASAVAGNEPLWVRHLGTATADSASGVATDAAGNVYLIGSTAGSLGGANHGDLDAWVAKFDANGDLLWTRQLGTETTDRATGVATDAAGNVYMTGATMGSLGGPNQGRRNDTWVAKYDAAGHARWVRQFGTAWNDYASRVATDAAGNVYLTGTTRVGGPRTWHDDAWVAKYDAAGHARWLRQLPRAGKVYASGVATDATGNVYLTGGTTGWLGGANRGWYDVWVAKYDAGGRRLWTRQLGTKDNDSASGVATDAVGNVYLTGDTDGSLGGANHGGADAWVAKYDGDGGVLWMRQLGTRVSDYARGLATDATGNVYLTGYTTGSFGGANRGWYDAWVAQYDADGDVLWKRQLGTEDADVANGVATDATGNVYLTGDTEGSLGGAQRGDGDAWVAKYSTQP